MDWESTVPYKQWNILPKEFWAKVNFICIIMESRKLVLMVLLAGQTRRHRHKGQTCGHSGGRRGPDGIIWESSLRNIYITICNVDIPWEFGVWLKHLEVIGREPKALSSVITWRGGMGKEVGGEFKREGTYVQAWPIHVDIYQKPSQYCNYPVIRNFKREIVL